MSDSTDSDTASMTRDERIRAAARGLRTPRTASWVADETDVSTETAQNHLDRLVEDDILRRVERGTQTLYCVDRLMAAYREVATLQREHSREDLADTLETMQTKISDWKVEYGVDSPGELRASTADFSDMDEIETRREIASEWEHVSERIQVVSVALNEYDVAAERDAIHR